MRDVVLLAVAYVAAARVFELGLSRRNAARVLARGGRLVQRDGIGALAAVHILLIVALPAEELVLGPGLPADLRCVALALFLAAEGLRYWTIATLGERWNVRVIVIDGAPRVARGPFRLVRHPNYLGAAVGVAALPLALGLPWTGAALIGPKLWALGRRIRVEEAALRAAGGQG